MGAYDAYEQAVEAIGNTSQAILGLPGTFQTYALPQAHEGIVNLATYLEACFGAVENNLEAINGLNTAITQLGNSVVEIANSLTELATGLSNEASAREASDDNLQDEIDSLKTRIDRLLYDPIPEDDSLNGKRKYLTEFAEVLSVDQVDGLTQRLSAFTNTVASKVSDISAEPGTGITIEKTNPILPRIVGNSPFWNNIQSKPNSFPPSVHQHGISDVTNLGGILNSKAEANHSHIIGNITGLQPALDSKADLVAGKVPASQLPSYVDDVLEFSNLSSFPGSGESGKIYVALDSGKIYRWSGTSYIEIVSSPGSSDAIPEGLVNRYFTVSRENALNSNLAGKEPAISTGLASQFWNGLKQWVSIGISDISGLASALAGKASSIHSHGIPDVTGLQTALDGKRNTGAIPPGDISQDASNRFVTDSEKLAWNSASGGSVPIGTVLEYGGSTPPTGYLMCDGSAVSRTTYASLFSAISTTYGAGNGTTTFNIPDRRGNVGRGAGTSSGYSQNVTIALGAKTDDALEEHNHFIQPTAGNGMLVDHGTTNYVYFQPPNITNTGNVSSGRKSNETRVKSLGMNYIIRFQ